MKKITSIVLALMMILSVLTVGVMTANAETSEATIFNGYDDRGPNYVEDSYMNDTIAKQSPDAYGNHWKRDTSGRTLEEMKSIADGWERIDDGTTQYSVYKFYVRSTDLSLQNFNISYYQDGWKSTEGIWYDTLIWSDADTIYFPPDCDAYFKGHGYYHLDLNGFDFSKVTTVGGMFSDFGLDIFQNEDLGNYYDYNGEGQRPEYYIDTVDLSPMNIVNCTYGSSMCSDYDPDSYGVLAKHLIMPNCTCPNWEDNFPNVCGEIIESIDWSKFILPNMHLIPVGNYYLSELKVLDISGVDLNQVSYDYWGGFRDFASLETIYVSPDTDIQESQFTSEEGKNNYFDNSQKLVGGQGTTWSVDHIDWTYARIDGKDGLPGYFTAKLPEEPVDETKILASGNNGKSIVTLDYDTANLRVTVPTVLPVSVDSDNNVTVSDNAKIVNYSKGQVDVTNAVLSGNNSWTLAAFDTDFTKVPVDTKQYGFKLQGYSVPVSGNAYNNQFDTIDGGAALDLSYDANVAIQSEATKDAEIGNIVFTVAWHK